MKKHLSVILAVILVMSLLAPMAFAAESELSLELRVVGEAEVGGTMTVELWCTGNPGIFSAQFTLGFDENVLDCVECDAGKMLRGMMAAKNADGEKGAVIAVASGTAVKGDGQLASYTFDVLSAGECKFELVDVEFALGDGTQLAYTITGLSQTISSDGSVEQTDDTPNVVQPGAEEAPFSDISGHWAEEYLLEGAERGILQGYPDGTCGPDEAVTRAQFVTFLWRSVGEPKAEKASTFTDLDPTVTYYHDAVAWAQESQYILGVGDGLFLPNDPISRQEVALILWRVAGGKTGGEQMFGSIYDKHYTDSSETSDWAKHAVYWAIYNEVWCGVGSVQYGNVLGAQSDASRAEIVVMMVNYQNEIQR